MFRMRRRILSTCSEVLSVTLTGRPWSLTRVMGRTSGDLLSLSTRPVGLGFGAWWITGGHRGPASSTPISAGLGGPGRSLEVHFGLLNVYLGGENASWYQ